MRKKELDPIILEIITADPHMTLQEVAEAVYQQTGYEPSKSVVFYAFERLGIKSDSGKARKWVFPE